ncbi:ABC transporter ATP-binding protein [Niabella ginsengisoli]|uniref:ATP-binding cassette domain-containing protein n=1 Tax=Niabella ginsengisoli TaxID=522298 RepID=A0ABS9SPP2_9BACT|nr:ATP-binding cassette domain-containing protein [Niabella ginsengisoli]MCH5600333.1 ATP-binding cassette domain-containing protein [Niabella ginsengisoli]
MTIQLHNAGKRYNRDWIFRGLTYDFHTGSHYAITGPNGSGKSTLLQILSGAVTINEGTCTFALNNQIIAPEKIYNNISYCAPYLELVEEFTLTELLNFHQSFKPFLNKLSTDFIANEVQLEHAQNKKISEYSSGMKQRAKLAQCIFSDTPLVLLDEPCTNLDAAGIDLYNYLVHKYCANRLVIVSSNDKQEYGFCNEVMDITAYK